MQVLYRKDDETFVNIRRTDISTANFNHKKMDGVQPSFNDG